MRLSNRVPEQDGRTFDHSSMSISPTVVSIMTRPLVGSAICMCKAMSVDRGRMNESCGGCWNDRIWRIVSREKHVVVPPSRGSELLTSLLSTSHPTVTTFHLLLLKFHLRCSPSWLQRLLRSVYVASEHFRCSRTWADWCLIAV